VPPLPRDLQVRLRPPVRGQFVADLRMRKTV
jgi:hypothetical protein